MLVDAVINIDCPDCSCKVGVALSRVIVAAGVFCPACHVHISFVDDRAGTKAADRVLSQFMRQFPKTIEINLEL